MTRADHASGSDRIFEALGKIDPAGQAEIVVNVQGDLPTLDAGRHCGGARSARRSGGRYRDAGGRNHQARRAHQSQRGQGGRHAGRAVAAARALFLPRHRARGRRAALSPYRALRLSPRGARALRQAAAVAARAAREARAAARARSRHAHRRRDRRYRAARRRYAGGFGNRARHANRATHEQAQERSLSRASRAPIRISPAPRPIRATSRCRVRPSRTRSPRCAPAAPSSP